MAGNKIGGMKAAATNKRKYGDDWYKKIGSVGGRNSGTGGFWHAKYITGDVHMIQEAGKKGGRISRRKPKQ